MLSVRANSIVDDLTKLKIDDSFVVAIATKIQLVQRTMIGYFVLVSLPIAMSGCCAIVCFDCTMMVLVMMPTLSMCLPVCGKQNLSRSVMTSSNCWYRYHCMVSVDWFRRTVEAKMAELHSARLMHMQNILRKL